MLHDFNYSIDEQNGIKQLVVIGGKLYFRGYDPDHGFQIWTSDGTVEGTKRITDLNGSIYDLDTIGGIRALDDYVTFHVYNNSEREWEIRKTDGESEASTLIFEGGDRWFALKAIDNKLYFRGYDSQHGHEPWVSDGTIEGTHMIKDINPDTNNSDPFCFVKGGDLIYFSAKVDSNHRCLFKSDGTENGTNPLICGTDTSVWSTNLFPTKPYKGKIYFRFKDSNDSSTTLWVSDGTAQGTRKVFGAEYDQLNPRPIIPVGDYLFFRNDNDDELLYAWNGTASEPTLLLSEQMLREQNITRIHNFRVVGEEL